MKKLLILFMLVSISYGQWAYDPSTTPPTIKIYADIWGQSIVAEDDLLVSDSLTVTEAASFGGDVTASAEVHIADSLIVAGASTFAGAITLSGDLNILATNKLYLDDGGNTYITEASADAVSVYTNGGLSAIVDDDAMLDLYGGTISILAGAQDGLKTRTNNQVKFMRFGMPHRSNNTIDPVAIIFAEAENGANILNIGGGSSAMTTATLVKIFAADNSLTTTGTEVARFETSGIDFSVDISVPTKTPSGAGDTGVAGTITWDATYLYVCTATNTWQRMALGGW